MAFTSDTTSPSGPSTPPLDEAPTPPPDRTRAGALWVSATGAFLLLAAASIFVAVQWSALSDEVKFAILATVTGATLLGGRRARASLPATSNVVFHLGALLIPMNVAAVSLHLQLAWPQFLLAVAAVSAATWWALAQVESSPVLRWAAGLAAIAVAGGFGAVSGLPAPLVLAVMAVVAEALQSRRCATGWALVAGLAPALAAADLIAADRVQVLAALGFGSTGNQFAAASAVMATVVLCREAKNRNNLALVGAAVASLVIGVGQSWTDLGFRAGVDVLGIATVFLLIELLAALVRSNEFWARPSAVAASIAEVLAAVALGTAVLVGGWRVAHHVTDPSLVVAGVVAALAWLIADVRRAPTASWSAFRIGHGWPMTAPGFALSIVAGVSAGSGSPIALSITLVSLAAVLITSGRPGAAVTGLAMSLAAPFTAVELELGLLLTGCAASLVLAFGSSLDNRRTSTVAELRSWAMSIGAAIAALTTWALVLLIRSSQANLNGQLPGWTMAALVGWLVVLASVADQGISEQTDFGPGSFVRLVIVSVVLVTALGSTTGIGDSPHFIAVGDAMIVASVASAGLLGWAVVRGRPQDALAAGLTVPIGAGVFGRLLGCSISETGLVVAISGSVAAGLYLLAPKQWQPVLFVTQAVAFLIAASLAAGDPSALTSLLLIVGGVIMAYAIVERSALLAGLGWFAATVGIWGHLQIGSVGVLDAYAAPVAIGLFTAGFVVRHSPANAPHGVDGDRASGVGANEVSSWVAYGPAIVLLGGTALLERIDSGLALHALLAGALGLTAVLVGGAKRLAGPLVMGTVLLVALTIHESLTVTAQVPTWGWLAVGGAVLVGAGVVMERAETGPRETGQRIVDTVKERFS